MNRRIIVIIDWCNNENCFQDSRIHWSGNEDPEGEFPALSDRTEGAETQSGRSDIRQPRQEEMQTVLFWQLEGGHWAIYRNIDFNGFHRMVKVMFEDGNEPGIIFQHSLSGRKVRSLWITGSREPSEDMQGWKGNFSNLSRIINFYCLLLSTFPPQIEFCQVTVSPESWTSFR